MRRILFGIILVCVTAFSGCTKGEYIIYEDEIACKVYFVQAVTSELHIVSEESLDETGCVTFALYCAGNNHDEVSVDVLPDQYALDIYNVENGLDLVMLPDKYWSVGQKTFVMDTRGMYQQQVHVAIDFDAVKSDGLNVSSYIIPLSAETPSMADVTYDYRTVFIQLSL